MTPQIEVNGKNLAGLIIVLFFQGNENLVPFLRIVKMLDLLGGSSVAEAQNPGCQVLAKP
jgi:hypothetical protein